MKGEPGAVGSIGSWGSTGSMSGERTFGVPGSSGNGNAVLIDSLALPDNSISFVLLLIAAVFRYITSS